MVYVKYSSPDVSLNLAAEYYFASERTFDTDVFMLWQPRPTVVVGNFQNIHEEVDTAYAASRGIDIVRRLSGGGTVYQDGGSIQYAFIERRDGDIDFVRYLTPICQVLKSLGIDAVPNGRNDITVDGKNYAAKWDENGIRFSTGERVSEYSSALIPWESVDKRIRELMNLGQYLSKDEQEKAESKIYYRDNQKSIYIFNRMLSCGNAGIFHRY